MTARAPLPRPLAPLVPWILAAALLAVLPVVFPSAAALTIMNQMAITIVFALAYNMLLGQGGMLSFGHAVYMGIGGFAAVHVMRWVEWFDWPLPLPALPIVAGLAGFSLALVVGLFSTRRAGTVFAMISLGVGELIAASSVILVAFFGGEEGVSADRTYGLPVLGMDFAGQEQVYGLTALWLLVSAGLMYLFALTPAGRMAEAVRDNPQRAAFLGYSPRWVRYVTFVASGFFAGVAGGLFAINFEIMSAENLDLSASGTILLVVFLGGTGAFYGPVLGAVVFTLLQTVLGLQTDLWQLYVGALFVATVMFFPEGLAGLIEMHRPVWRAGRMHLLWRPWAAVLLPGTLAVLAGAALLEMLFHVRSAAPGEERMTLFWITFDSHAPLPWLVAAAVLVAGILLTRRALPALKAAWAEAAHRPEGAP